MDQADPIRWTPHIGQRPILFIHGARDPFVSFDDVQNMASLAAGPVDVWVVEGAGHREAYTLDPVEYNNRIINWFTRYMVEEKGMEEGKSS